MATATSTSNVHSAAYDGAMNDCTKAWRSFVGNAKVNETLSVSSLCGNVLQQLAGPPDLQSTCVKAVNSMGVTNQGGVRPCDAIHRNVVHNACVAIAKGASSSH